jgi:peptide/nickel transport system permease protein
MRFALRRVAYLALILLIVTFLVSSMLELMPGDPAYAILGDNATQAQVDALHERLNLDEPVVTRYLSWLQNAVSGDLGRSLRGNTPVTELIAERLPVTLQLVIMSQMFALLFAIPTALVAAYKPRKTVDTASSGVALAMISIPHFVLSLFLVLIFAVKLGWFPVAGFTPIRENPVENLQSMVLPTIAVAAAPAGIYQRLLRGDLSGTLREDYIAMAEAKGQSPSRVLFRHALRPSLFSLLTLIGLTIGGTLGGSVIVELIFGLPGLGRLLVTAIEQRDIVVVQGVVAVAAVGYVVMNGLVDLFYGVADPRVRRGNH